MIRILLLTIALGASTVAQTPAPNPNDPNAAARKLLNEGKHDEAIAAFAKNIAADKGNWQAHVGLGAALDLQGKYEEARKHFQHAIELAPADGKPNAWRGMLMSYGFDRNAKSAEEYGKRVFDYRVQKNDPLAAAEAANELARVLLESGDAAGAEKWYRTGHETALKKSGLSQKDQDLWDFRWASAQARLAARRGNQAEAQKHARAAERILSSGTNPEQAPYGPYVNGYVAFYAGDYKTAISEFSKSNQNDPFNLVMIAQAYEKLGDRQKATDYYQKVLAANQHNPTNAYARPIAKERLKGKS